MKRLIPFIAVFVLVSLIGPSAAAGKALPSTPEAFSPTDGPETPDGYVLSAAYPNPFNPTTTFSLTVDQRQEVTVEVFNLLGQRVRELYTGLMEAAETRAFTFEAGDLPSGIYLYRVQGESFTATRQVTLLK